MDKNFGAVATIRPDGTPHVTPVWIDYDGERPLFNTATGRAKWQHMQRDPRVTIEVYSQENPYEYVTVSGTVELEEGTAADRHIDKLSEKYTGKLEVPEPPAGRTPGDRADHSRASPRLITICEVGPRDGLQNERDILPPETRAELINRLAATGLRRIEVVSFVRDDAVPQAAAEDVIGEIDRPDGVEYAGLVLNEKGFERFQASAARPRQRDARRDGELQPAERERLARRGEGARFEDRHCRGRRRRRSRSASRSAAPSKGRVDPAVVSGLVDHFRKLGAPGDRPRGPIGVATPLPGRGLARAVEGGTASTATTLVIPALRMPTRHSKPVRPPRRLDRRPRWVSVRAARDGDIATEDLEYVLEGDGIETGVDLDALIAISEWLEGVLGRQLEGQLYRAGAFPASLESRST